MSMKWPRFSVFVILLCQYMVLVLSGWVDPDTKKQDRITKSFYTGKQFEVVMSDEFEVEGRSFADGHDPMWCAMDKSDDDQTSTGRKSLQVSY
jgi:hypothetical protein